MITVGIVDDDELVRKGICDWLSSVEDFEIVFQKTSAEETMNCIESQLPEVILVDIMLPGVSGIELVRMTKARFPKARCLILSGSHASEILFDAFSVGAFGFLPKKVSPQELEHAVRVVAHGDHYLSPMMTHQFVSRALEMKNKLLSLGENVKLSHFSDRERELLKLVAEGHTFSEIARQLSINARSVERIKSRIETKLNAKGLSCLVREAIRLGLVRA